MEQLIDSEKVCIAEEAEILRLIRLAIEEDLRTGDITSEACIDQDETISARLLLKQCGYLAGLPFLLPVFREIDPRISMNLFVDEGSYHEAGTLIGTVDGPARGILSAERVALNLIQHASGVATATAKYVEQLKGLNCDILDTRKTLPGLRALEKYAVRVGGGKNHRYSLDERFLIKDNHLAFIAKGSRHPIQEAVQKARAYRPGVLVEVEVETLEMVAEALNAKADIIMLDNMSIAMVRKAVELIKGNAYVEASGNMTLEVVRSYAETGVNGISIGALTHSASALDISLKY